MVDNEIIEMYWNRKENAIKETYKKYGKYCHTISINILQNKEDSKESVNDTYLQIRNNIPPERPNRLKAYLGRITRNIALNLFEKKRALKRDYRVEIALEELNECIESENNFETEIDFNELVNNLNIFLSNLTQEKRRIFIQRYWYLYSIKEISLSNDISESNIKVMLLRIRKQLKDYLKDGGLYE